MESGRTYTRPRQAAVGVICRDGKYLVITRSDEVRAPGEACFPGGGIEESETAREALIREMKEELGLVVDPIEEIWQSYSPWKVRLFWWHAEIGDDVEIKPNPAEVKSYDWLTLDEILVLPNLLPTMEAFIEAHARGVFDLPE